MEEEEEAGHDILIMGSSYIPNYDDDESTLFNYKDMNKDFTSKLENLPIYLEHDTRHQIGTVVDSFIDEKRHVKSLLHIHGNKTVNNILPGTLYQDPENDNNRYYKGLSLGNDVKLVKDGEKVSVKSNVPSEISIVMNPDRANCYINDYWFLPNNTNVKDFIREKIEPTIQRFDR